MGEAWEHQLQLLAGGHSLGVHEVGGQRAELRFRSRKTRCGPPELCVTAGGPLKAKVPRVMEVEMESYYRRFKQG